jgi:hypothetical protein
MALPQLAGRTCVRCRLKIHSIGDGEFCCACANPVHFACLDRADEPVQVGHCLRCGGDHQSVIASKVLDARKNEALLPSALTCPNCGSTGSFSFCDASAQTYPGAKRSSGVRLALQGIASLLFTNGERQCSKCLFVFRPRRTAREITWFLFALVGILMLATLVAWKAL